MSVEFVIPYYGDPAYLVETIDSIRRQTCQDWCLTVVDDQYPGTRAAQYIESLRDHRIRYRRNKARLGPNGNTYQCSRLATREFVCMMGADDLLDPAYVEVVLERMRAEPRAAAVQPGVRVIDEASVPVTSRGAVDRVKRALSSSARRAGVIGGESAAKSLLTGNWLYTPSLCYRRSALAEVPFREGIDAIHDLAMTVDMLTAGGKILLDSRDVFRYRRHTRSDSAQRVRGGERFHEELRYYAAIAEELRDLGWRKVARAADLHLFSRLHALQTAVGQLAAGDLAHARPLLRHTVRL
jgi:glycosyltransferase involved in cell wall biosynthesis